jgi:phenylalanine-4-hydroxylase
MPQLEQHACEEYLQGFDQIGLQRDAIPNLADVNQLLRPRTGWNATAVSGFLPAAAFFEMLAARQFPTTTWLRSRDSIEYTPEPDIFHDVFGHVPMLLHPGLADYMQAYGLGGLRAQSLGMLPQLSRVYWYTVEFGLVREAGGVRLYGSGIASSFRESVFCLDDPSPNRIGFALERVMRTRYRIDDFQETYFVIDSLDALLELARIDFGPAYARLPGQAEFEPGAVLPDDRVLQRGTGSYHAQRRN